MEISSLGIAVDSQPVKTASDNLENLTNVSKKAEDAAQKIIDKWKLKAATLNATAREVEAYKLALGGATQSQLAEADAALRAIDAHEKLQQKLKNARQFGEDLGSALKKGFLLAVAGATAFLGALDLILGKIGDVQDISERTGANVDWLLKFKTSADVTSTSLEQVGNAMNQMSRQLARGSDESKGAARGLAAIGISIESFRRLDPGAQFDLLAKKLAEVEDNGGKVALVQDIMGRSAAQMLPMLKDYAEHIDRQTVLTKEAVKAADDFHDRQAELLSIGKQWVGQLAVATLPILSAFEEAAFKTAKQMLGIDDATNQLKNNSGIKDFAKAAALGLAYLVDIAADVVRGFEHIGLGIASLAAASAAFVSIKIFDPQSWKSGFRQIDSIFKDFSKDVSNIWSNRPSMVDNLRVQLDQIDKATAETGKKAKANLDLSGYTSRDATVKKDPTIAETARLIDAIQKRQLAEESELQTGKKLTDFEKFEIAVITEVYSAKSKLSDAQKRAVMDALAEAKAVDDNLQLRKQEQTALQQTAALQDQVTKEVEKETEARHKAQTAITLEIAARNQENKDAATANQIEADTIGKTDQERRIANATLQEEIKWRKELQKINDTAYDTPEQRAATVAAAEKAHVERLQNETNRIIIEGNEQTFNKANDIAHQFFTDVFTDGTEAFRNLGHSIKTLLIDALYELTVKKWVINIVANLTGAGGIAGAAAGAAGSAGLGSVFNALGTATSTLTSVTGGAIGATLGLGSLGAGLMTGFNALGGGVAGIGGALSAGASAIGAGQVAGGLGMIAGALGPIALGVAGLMKLFGGKRGGPKVEGSAGYGVGNSLDYGQFGNELDSNAAKAVNSLNDTYKKLAAMLGTLRDDITFGVGFSTDPRGTAPSFVDVQSSTGANSTNRNVGRSDEELQKALAEQSAFVIVDALRNSGMDTQVLAYWDKITTGMTYEEKLAAVEQVAQMQQIRVALQQMNIGVKGLSDVSLDATANLVRFAGGIQNLQAGLAAFQQNFFTAAEQQQMTMESIAKQLNAAGSGWQGFSAGLLNTWSKDFFRQVVEGLDTTTEAGQRQFASLIQVAGAFAQVKDAQEQAAQQAQMEAEQAKAKAEADAQRAQMEAQQAEEARKQRDQMIKDFNSLIEVTKIYHFSLQNFGNASQIVVNQIANLVGGVNDLTGQLNGLMGNFSTFAERKQAVATQLANAFFTTGDSYYQHLANPAEAAKLAREDYIQIFRTIDLSTESGKRLAAEMLRLQDAFAGVTEAIREPVYFTVSSALEAINQKYEDQVGSLKDLKDRMQSANDAFDDFMKSTLLDPQLSQLTPAERMHEVQQQYEQARIQMQADNYSSDSVSKFNDLAKQVLTQGRDFYGSGSGYTNLYEKINADMEAARAYTALQKSDTERQITALDAQVAQFKDANRTLTSIDEGIQILNQVYRGALIVQSTPYGTRTSPLGIPSHALGLERVPYNGYVASLHEGERVQTASEVQGLVAELRQLRAEVVRLRSENRQDAGNAIAATMDAAREAARQQTDATIKAASQRSYQSKRRPTLA